MELTRRSLAVYGSLAALWIFVLAWQIEEHRRVQEAARATLSNRSKDIANTVSACIRGMRFRGTVLQERLEPVLNELVNGATNELVKSSELISLVLLNASGEPVASAGAAVDIGKTEILQKGEIWQGSTAMFLSPVNLGSPLPSDGGTNPTVVLPPFHGGTNNPPPRPPYARREPRPDEPGPPGGLTNTAPVPEPPPGDGREARPREGDTRFRRPFWLRGMDEQEYRSLMEKRALHGLIVAVSTRPFESAVQRDFWLRAIIVLMSSLSVIGSGLAWRNVAKSSDLQIRLVRASELNTHLREMNLAAAGLAHETRNPLNIIRGLAHLISRQPDSSPEMREKAKDIINEADKVAAQLNEFINYSRPREVRRTSLSLSTVINEVVRALGYDLEEKKVKLDIKADPVVIEADDQLLRQTLFNLLLNAIQAVNDKGQIDVVVKKDSTEAILEIRDNGPGVAPEHRTEIFKPYFTTQKKGTGLGLAVVQQIVLAHGWEIECAANQPNGAIFRIRHLRLAS